jgi:hypothetical protein
VAPIPHRSLKELFESQLVQGYRLQDKEQRNATAALLCLLARQCKPQQRSLFARCGLLEMALLHVGSPTDPALPRPCFTQTTTAEDMELKTLLW